MDFHRAPTLRSSRRLSRKRGISLVEVMIAATIFTVLSMSATAMFLQNQRASIAIRYRTQVTNTALNILEQLRLKNYTDLETLHRAAVAAPTTEHTTLVLIADPAYVPPTPNPYADKNFPDGLRPVELKLNVVDGDVINTTHTPVNVPMEADANAPELPTRYWLTLRYNDQRDPDPELGGIVQAMEVALVFQWRMPQRTEWQEGTVRLAVVNPQALKTVAKP